MQRQAEAKAEFGSALLLCASGCGTESGSGSVVYLASHDETSLGGASRGHHEGELAF
jgi:hypothetical protein